MEIRPYATDILITAVLIVSTLFLVFHYTQDPAVAAAASLMMLSIGGLFLSMHAKVRKMEDDMLVRERMIRTGLEEVSARMVQKYDAARAHLDELVAELSRRAYR